MSLEYELYKHIGKRPCSPGTRVERCPLIINENSEDLLISNTFGRLKYLSLTLWLTSFLNIVFKGRDFRKLSHVSPKIEFWKKLKSPASFKDSERIEEVDIVVTIGQVVILIECKYRSPVQPEVVGHKRDQIIRYLDAAVFNYWPDSDIRTEIFFILLTDTEDEPAVLSQYRDPNKIREGLTQNGLFIDYEQVSEMLSHNIAWGRWTDILTILKSHDLKKVPPIEAMIIKDLIAYLSHKTAKGQNSKTMAKGR